MGHLTAPQLRRTLVDMPKVWQRLQHTFPGWAEQLSCATCLIYRQRKRDRVQRPITRPEAPGLDYAMDFASTMVPSKEGHYVTFFIIIDCFTRYKWAVGMNEHTAACFIREFLRWWRLRRQRSLMQWNTRLSLGQLLPVTTLTTDRDSMITAQVVR